MYFPKVHLKKKKKNKSHSPREKFRRPFGPYILAKICFKEIGSLEAHVYCGPFKPKICEIILFLGKLDYFLLFFFSTIFVN